MTDVSRLDEGERLLALWESLPNDGYTTTDIALDVAEWYGKNFPWMRDVIRAAEPFATDFAGDPFYEDAVANLRRAFGYADEKPNPQSCPTCGGEKNHRPGCQDTWAAFEEMGG